MNKIGIYIIENNITKEVYIGSTIVSFDVRFKQHKKELKKNKHHSKLLQQAYDKYGNDNFSFKILEIIDDKNTCRDVERTWINTILPEYNMTHTVSRAVVYTKELSRKMSESQGSKPFDMYKGDIYIGTFFSQSFCAREYNLLQSKIGEVLKGNRETTGGYKFKTVNEDFKYKKLPRKKADLTKRIWKKHTDDTKKLIGLKCKGRKISEESKAKQRKTKIEGLVNGKYKTPDFSNKQVRINLARSLFKGILKVYYCNIYVGSYYSTLEAAEALNLNKQSLACCVIGLKKSLYKYTFKKESIND
jgi:group I intron endonuclease